jgi:hypothetical protein
MLSHSKSCPRSKNSTLAASVCRATAAEAEVHSCLVWWPWRWHASTHLLRHSSVFTMVWQWVHRTILSRLELSPRTRHVRPHLWWASLHRGAWGVEHKPGMMTLISLAIVVAGIHKTAPFSCWRKLPEPVRISTQVCPQECPLRLDSAIFLSVRLA